MITALRVRSLVALVMAPFFLYLGAEVAADFLCTGSVHWSIGLFLKAMGGAGIILFVLGNYRVINRVWTACPALNAWMAPNLNGTYELKTSSNWSIQQAMLAALKGDAPQSATYQELFQVAGTLRIKMGLLRLRVKYTPAQVGTSRSRSDVVAASIRLDEQTATWELHYVYRSFVSEPNRDTDSQVYFGAARFEIPRSGRPPDTLNGSYWTNRSWEKGINTAGNATATRVAAGEGRGAQPSFTNTG